jgi:hypothetical protein
MMHVTWHETQKPGVFEWEAAGLKGRSRTPFLAAARALLDSGIADPSEKLTGGRSDHECDLSGELGMVAKLAVSETGGAPKFVQYRKWRAEDK